MGKDGFTSGDFDPAFPLDDKFITLSTLVADRAAYYEAVGVYWHVVAAAWRDGVRRSIARAAPGARPEIVNALITAELVDPDQALPGTSFDRWVGTAQRRRAGWAERKRMERESTGVSGTPRESPATSAPAQRPPVRDVSTTPRESDVLSGTPPESRIVPTSKQTDGQVKKASGRGVGEPTPTECREPKAHRASWVTFAGVGTRCPTCFPTEPLPAWTPPPAAT